MRRAKRITRKVSEHLYYPVRIDTEEQLSPIMSYYPLSLRDIKRIESRDNCIIVAHTVEVKNYSVDLEDFIKLARSYQTTTNKE